MAEPLQIPTEPMTRDEYYRWAEQQPRGRFELVDGFVTAMAPERVAHARAKARAWLALGNAISVAEVRCEAFMDGLAVEVGPETAYEPDALVNCGDAADPESLVAPAPIIVVEVVSPSTSRVDTVQKLADYFRVPSIHHYLIVDARRRMAIHHQRLADGTLGTRIAATGPIVFDPPGITITVESLFEH